MPITIHQLAEHRLGRAPVHGGDYAEAGLSILGGCAGCQASLAAYNAHPTKSGFWCCRDCVGDSGWESVAHANADIFGAICVCNHWYEEHDVGEECGAPNCTCLTFRFDSVASTPEAIADRGGDPEKWPEFVKNYFAA